MSDEVEVTPEMIDAGLKAYLDHDEILETKREMIAAIFRAMVRASRTAPPASEV